MDEERTKSIKFINNFLISVKILLTNLDVRLCEKQMQNYRTSERILFNSNLQTEPKQYQGLRFVCRASFYCSILKARIDLI